VVCQLRSESALRHGVDQQRQGHHHEQSFHPAGFFDKERGDKKQRVFEKPTAAFDVRLPFVGGDALRIAELPSGDIGAQDQAGLCLRGLLSGGLIRMDLRLDLPRARLAWPARCGTAFTRVACVFRQRRGRNAVILPVRGQYRQGRVSGLGGAKALGVEVERAAL
jgi:hypothetical protein